MSTPITPTSAEPVNYTVEELHDSLVTWVSFTVPNLYLISVNPSTPLSAQLRSCLALGGTHTFDGTSLDDGLTIAQCLGQLAPATFTEQWKEKIISDTAGNWRLKVR